MKLNLDSTETTTNNNQEKKDTTKMREQMRKRMILVFGVVLGIVLLILLVLFIVSLFTSKKYSYYDIEKIMKDAAVKYYDNHKGRLPQNNETVEAVDDDILVRNEYMKPLSEYLEEGVNCLGKVEVDYNNGSYIYTPYLECGKAYSTTELYKKVTENKNLVVSGYGLYNINNEYVYRGENVNNYITLDGKTDEDSLWRIVKFTQNGEAVLIKNEKTSGNWDDRFNAQAKYRTGINDYSLSRIKEELKKKYLSNDEKERILTKEAREKLVVFDQCSGKRAQDYTTNDNSAECSVRTEKQRIGLLTLSDYLNASTDPNCTSIYARSCQNYNYLRTENPWWLATALTENTNSVYYVNNSGYIEKTNASSIFYIRPVVHLSAKAMYTSGKGTQSNPYRIR